MEAWCRSRSYRRSSRNRRPSKTTKESVDHVRRSGGGEKVHEVVKGEENEPNPKNRLCIPCYEYHLYSSEGQDPEYIYVQEGENIQKNPERNTIIKKANTYLIYT
jgi:hypothetical protein